MYIAHLLDAPVAARQKARMAQGNAVVHIRGNHLAEVYNTPLPSRSEHRAMTPVLSDMDAEITALKRRPVKVRAVKQGMMQQLLTGTNRLPSPDGVAEDERGR